MNVIKKIQVGAQTKHQRITISKGCIVRSVADINNNIFIWYQGPAEPSSFIEMDIHVLQTSDVVPENTNFVGTVQHVKSGHLSVRHIYYGQQHIIEQGIVKDYFGIPIPPNTRGILYLCSYFYTKPARLIVEVARYYDNQTDAIEAYANIPNPASQLAMGKDWDTFKKELKALHDRMNDPEWVKELGNTL